MSSETNDTEHSDRIHECLEYVPIYKKGAFSSTNTTDDDDDDDDDEDVKRILAEHGELEPKYRRDAVDFSATYKAAVAAETESSSVAAATTDDNYKDWDEAFQDVRAVYPPLGVRRTVSKSLMIRKLDGPTSEARGHCRPAGNTTANELRKCLERALYGQDPEEEDFEVAQPYCVANKNLDLGKPKTSLSAMHASRTKVENWMSKCIGDDRTAL